MSRWEPLPFWGCLVVSMVAFFTPGPDLPASPQVSDKVEHAAIFLVLAVTGRIAGHPRLRLGAGLLGYAVLSEVLQAVLPIQRDGDWHDVVADTVGMLLGLLAVAVVLRVVGLNGIRPAADAGSRGDRADRSAPRR